MIHFAWFGFRATGDSLFPVTNYLMFFMSDWLTDNILLPKHAKGLGYNKMINGVYWFGNLALILNTFWISA